jgi:hypothetical protein
LRARSALWTPALWERVLRSLLSLSPVQGAMEWSFFAFSLCALDLCCFLDGGRSGPGSAIVEEVALNAVPDSQLYWKTAFVSCEEGGNVIVVSSVLR